MADSIAGSRPGELYNDSFDVVFSMWAKKKPADVFRAGSSFIDLFKNLSLLSDDSNLPVISAGLKDAKAILAPASFLDNMNILRTTVWEWLNGKKTFTDVGRKSLRLVSPAYEFIDLLAKKILSVPAYCLNAFKGINGVVLVIIMGWDAKDSLTILKDGSDKFQLNKSFLKVVYQVAFIALGVMTALTCFYGMVFAPLTYSVLSVVTVVFSFADYFYDNIGKKKDLEVNV